MLDLQQFCGTDASRTNIQQPFSRGAWSYATNGHIMVRVSRRAEVPEIGDAPNVEAVVALSAEKLTGDFIPLPKIEFPPPDKDNRCPSCDGSGKEHDDCPCCQCKCESCDGTGEIDPYHDTTVGICGAIYNGRYIAMLQKLPNVTIRTHPEFPAHFMFDGGEGWLMPMRGKHGTHIEAIP